MATTEPRWKTIKAKRLARKVTHAEDQSTSETRATPAADKPTSNGYLDQQTAPSARQRAKVLTAEQFRDALDYAKHGDLTSAKPQKLHPERDEAILRLSFQTGLRAREIAGLRWKVHVLDASGKVGKTLHITHDIGKRTVEREVPLAPEVRKALQRLYSLTHENEYVVYRLDRKPGKVLPNTLVKWFERFYNHTGYVGCSSHSGRRTFITRAARAATMQQGISLKDVQQLAGHARLETTGDYIEPSDNQRKLVSNLF